MKSLKKPVLAAVLLILSFSFSACSKSSKSGPKTRIVVMGNPMKLIEGATTNSEIDMGFFKDAQRVKMDGMNFFVEKKTVSTWAAKEDLEKER